MIALGIVGIPQINACADDSRGLVACLRDNADRKFDLPGEPPRIAETEAPQVVETPVASAVPVAEPSAPQAEILPAEAPASATTPAEASGAEPVPSSPPPAKAQPGQGGPLLPARPADIAAAPVTPPVEPTPPVQRQAALEKAAAPTTVALPRPSPQLPKPAPTVDMMVMAPIEDQPGPPLATPTPATQPEPAPVATTPAAPQSPKPLEEAVAPTTEIAALPKPMIPAATPPASAVPTPPAEEPAAELLAPDEQVAANEVPSAAEPPSAVAAPLILAPTIDAIELEGPASYISGSGPTGAIVRLYSDGKLLGESPVEEGRWLVEAGEILDAEVTELRAEAIEAETGKSLGESVITVEIELPEGQPSPAADAPAPAPAPAPAEAAPATPPTLTEPSPPTEPAPQLPDAVPTPTPPSDQPAPAEDPPAVDLPKEPASAPVAPTSEATPPPVVTPPDTTVVEEQDVPLPPLATTVPHKTSSSVEILPVPDTEFTPLPPMGATEHEPATIELPAPDKPALRAEFVLTAPETDESPSVTVLRLFPFGDPVYGRFSGGQAIIRRGDTLWSLARRYYGAGIHYDTIFKANRDQIRRPSRIYPGQVFDLPLVTEE